MSAALALWLAVLAGLLGLGAGLVRVGRRAGEADWGHPLLNVLDGLNRVFCARVHGFRHEPVPLPANGPALLVANHVSGLDPLLMIAACRRPLRFLIAVEQYRRFGLIWLFRAIGCIPVDRSNRPERAFRAALQALAAGEVVALFPHGAIHMPTRSPRPLKPGVARLAALSGAPVYPVRLEGIRGAGHTLAAVFLPSRAARLRSFAPLDCARLGREDCLQALQAVLDGEIDAGRRPQHPGRGETA